MHGGGVGTGVEVVGEGQEGGQDTRNLSFFTLLRPSHHIVNSCSIYP